MIFPRLLGQEAKRTCELIGSQRFAVCLVAFVMPAFNGRPYRLSSGFVCLAVAVALLIYSKLKHVNIRLPSSHARLTSFTWAGWVTVATISAFANLSLESSLNLFWGYLVPFMLFKSLVTLDNITREDFQWFLASLALGLAFRFGYGAWVFYSEWGLPPLCDLLVARYDLVRMADYMAVTFGNTGNSASILAITLPVLVLSLILVPMRKDVWLLVFVSTVIVILNILITGSRAAIIIVALVMAVSFLKMKSRWGYPLILILGLAAYLFIAHTCDTFKTSMVNVLTLNVHKDNSLWERYTSVKYGFDIMMNYPLGVGPGMESLYNPTSVSHQFAIAQGSQLGFLGMICSLLHAGLVIKQVFILKLSRQLVAGGPGVVFLLGAFSWIIYAMTTNIAVNSGPTIPWIGLLALFLALGNMAVRVKTESSGVRRGNGP